MRGRQSAGGQLGLAVVLAMHVAPAFARAPPEDAETIAKRAAVTTQRVVVGVVTHDAPYDTPELAQVLAAAFSGGDVAVEVSRLAADDTLLGEMAWSLQAAAQPDVRAVVWVHPVSTGQHRLFLYDPAADQTWVRTLPQASDPMLVLESFGIMLELQIRGLAQGPPRDMQPVARPSTQTQPPPVAAVPPAPESPEAHHWDLGIEYVGSTFDQHVPWSSGLGLRWDLELRSGGFVRLRPGVLLPRPLSPAAVKLSRLPIAVESGFRFRRQRRVRLDAGLAAVVEPMWWRGGSRGQYLARAGSMVRLGLGPVAGVDVEVWRGLALHAHVRGTAWIRNADLVVVDDAGRRTSRIRPSVVSATALVGLNYRW